MLKVICHSKPSAACPLKTIEVAMRSFGAHMNKHGDFEGTCDEKCAAKGAVYNSVTCSYDENVGSVRFLQVGQAAGEWEAGKEWGRQV